MNLSPRVFRKILPFALGCVAFCSGSGLVRAQDTLQVDPAHSTVKLTLGAALHTVHGVFQVKSGSLQLDRSARKLAGNIVIDAKSGVTGNSMRDRKMHKDVLESEKFPEIAFRPDRVEGTVPSQGKSTVQVHGTFTIHGADHEITVPSDVELSADHWSATTHFTLPYAAWGIKNPSTLFLHVSDTVEMEIAVSGSISKAATAAGQ